MKEVKKRNPSNYQIIALSVYRFSLEIECIRIIFFLNGGDVVRIKPDGAKIRVVTVEIEEGVILKPSDVVKNTVFFLSYSFNVFDTFHFRIFGSGRGVEDEFVGIDPNVNGVEHRQVGERVVKFWSFQRPTVDAHRQL